MTPASIIAALDKALAEYSQTVTLQRTTVDAEGAITVTQSIVCPATVRLFTPQDLEAPQVRDIRVVLSPTSLAVFGMPSRDDRILTGTAGNPSNIEQIETLEYGGALVRVNLLCRG
jgi:hypothetical protein